MATYIRTLYSSTSRYNKTGNKTYFPGGDNATDIFGNTLEQGFQPVQMADTTKASAHR